MNKMYKFKLQKPLQTLKYLQNLEKIPKFNNRRAFNKAVGPRKNPKLINVGPTSIPKTRVTRNWET